MHSAASRNSSSVADIQRLRRIGSAIWPSRLQSRPSTRGNQPIPPLHFDAAFLLLQRQTVASRAAVHTERVSLSLRNQDFSGRWERGSHFAKRISPFRDSSKASLIFKRLFNMPIRRIRNFYVFRREFHMPLPTPLSDPLPIFFLFCPSKRDLPLTALERLGIWAARRAREQAKKNRIPSRSAFDN
jgi:hypothetical protein